MTKTRGIAGLLLVAAALVAAAPAVGQMRHRHPVGFWASAAVGPTLPYEFGIIATAVVRYHRLVIRGRYASSAEFLGDWDEDVGVLLGMALSPEARRVQVTMGAGVGRVSGGRGCLLCGTQPISPSAALLLDTEVRVALTSFLGLTSYVFGNLNSHESFGGLAFGLFVGRL